MTEEKKRLLFDMVLVVELQQEMNGKVAPFISYKYIPEGHEEEADAFSASVTQFCFPDMSDFPTTHMESETFSFVLTDTSGNRRFGYCIRKLPPGTGPRFPVAYSIMAFFPSFQLYTKICEQVAYHYENSSGKQLKNFLTSVLENPFPEPGASFVVQVDMENKVESWRFTRPDDSDSQLEYANFEPLLALMDPTQILTIFISLLIERRIIFCSNKLSILSSCVQAAMALLYPFTWQHIFIPVLPQSLLSFCCAPMPFVVGILESSLQEVMNLPMDEVLIIHLDQRHFLRTPGDDYALIPDRLWNPLQKALRNTLRELKKTKKRRRKLAEGDEKMEKELAVYDAKRQSKELADAFCQFFVLLLNSYKKYIKGIDFDKEAFANDCDPEVQQFMYLFVGSQMFERFVEDRIHNEYQNGFFDRRIGLYAQLSTQQQLNHDMAASNINNLLLFDGDTAFNLGKAQSKKKDDKSVMTGFAQKMSFASLRKGAVIKGSSGATATRPNEDIISAPTLVQSTFVDRSDSDSDSDSESSSPPQRRGNHAGKPAHVQHGSSPATQSSGSIKTSQPLAKTLPMKPPAKSLPVVPPKKALPAVPPPKKNDPSFSNSSPSIIQSNNPPISGGNLNSNGASNVLPLSKSFGSSGGIPIVKNRTLSNAEEKPSLPKRVDSESEIDDDNSVDKGSRHSTAMPKLAQSGGNAAKRKSQPLRTPQRLTNRPLPTPDSGQPPHAQPSPPHPQSQSQSQSQSQPQPQPQPQPQGPAPSVPSRAAPPVPSAAAKPALKPPPIPKGPKPPIRSSVVYPQQ